VNISDPNRSFTASEWEALGATGRTTVMSLRDRNQGRGGRDGRGGRRVSFHDDEERNVSSTAIVEYQSNADEGSNNDQADNSMISSERGGRNGRGFGRGAYGQRGRGRF
jgi:hypothetical protein